MILLKGQGVSRGVVMGPLYFYRRSEEARGQEKGSGREEETARLHQAQQTAVCQLNALAERCRSGASEDAAVLFETHAMLTEDEDFTEYIQKRIEKENCSAEHAVQAAADRFAGLFAAMEDHYMQARAADIRDVARRLINILMGRADGGVRLEKPVVLAADDLAPSETVQLDKRMILGFITRSGSPNSHTAILARSMGIPAVCGLGEGLKERYDGQMVYVDGETGQIMIEPDEEALSAFDEKQRAQQAAKDVLDNMRGQADVTLDGREMMLYCNIASPADIPAVLENDGRGIGLFRSEFLYLSSRDFPTEEEQFRAYRQAAEAMEGRRVIIRTLDIGADKQAGYFPVKSEVNPALGLRGIRVCLSRPEIFISQLRALYRASAYGKIAIMFPMIASVWEVRECRRICQSVMAELDREGIPYNRDMEIGVMIETPASVLIADELAKEVDFFSVGTNDLTQYTLACDRQTGDLARFFDPYHPAVLRSIKLAADAAHAAGIWIGVCGELAADLNMLPFFLTLGVDELSVAPPSVLPLRMEIRNSVAGS